MIDRSSTSVPVPPARTRATATFGDLYRSENERQVRRAALLLGDEAAANDVVHDVFLRLFARWDAVADPGPYLHRMVLNACRDRARREGRWRQLLPRLVDRTGPEPDEILWDVIAGLPFNQRAVVVLRFYEAMTEAEIAETLGCRPGSVGPWLHRALTTMRKALQ